MPALTVVLHGSLAGLLPGGRLLVHARTALEAVKAVFLQVGDPADRRRVSVVDHDDIGDLVAPAPADGELHVVPSFYVGAAGKAFATVAIGAALVAASIYIPGLNAMVAGAMFSLGASAMLGGVMSLIAPAPDAAKQKNKQSNYLGAPGNTTAVGTRIPLPYGRCRLDGHILSFNIDAADVSY